jgi:hypothetical protein
MRSVWRDFVGFVRFAAGLRSFLKETISVESAREAIRGAVEKREQNFLEKLGRSVFSNPKSPYLRLFKEAGCEFGDVRTLVSQEGVESTLLKLRDAGIYVTWEEFKGRSPCRRGSATFQFHEGEFDNPIRRGHYTVTSGGTSGAPVRMRIDLEDHAESAPDWAVWFEAHGWMGQPLVFWTPTHTGMANRYLKCAKFGAPYARWFATTGMTAARDRFRSAITHGVARRVGGYSKPEFAPVSQPAIVGEYLVSLLRQGFRPLVNTAPSVAASLSIWAQERGWSLGGVSFLLGAEPVTAARVKTIEASGGRSFATYGTSEAGWIGAQFPDAEFPDEVHVFRDAYAVVPQRTEDEADATPLLLTGLRRASPKVLLNAEIGDSAFIVEGRGGPVQDELGYNLRLHTIRSFRKVTVFGATFAVADLYRILEESLPARFGGTLRDYQILEDEDERGVSRLRLLVSPEIGAISNTELRDFFLRELGRQRAFYGFMARVLEDADALRVERRQPTVTARDKLLPVHTHRSQ